MTVSDPSDTKSQRDRLRFVSDTPDTSGMIAEVRPRLAPILRGRSGRPSGFSSASRHVETLRRQQAILFEKRRQLDAAIDAIRLTELAVLTQSQPDWTRFTHIVREIEMQNNTEWSNRYYSPEAPAKIEEPKHLCYRRSCRTSSSCRCERQSKMPM
jgi:hypothetical protein